MNYLSGSIYSITSSIVIVSTALFTKIILKRAFTVNQIIGCVLVILGVVVAGLGECMDDQHPKKQQVPFRGDIGSIDFGLGVDFDSIYNWRTGDGSYIGNPCQIRYQFCLIHWDLRSHRHCHLDFPFVYSNLCTLSVSCWSMRPRHRRHVSHVIHPCIPTINNKWPLPSDHCPLKHLNYRTPKLRRQQYHLNR